MYNKIYISRPSAILASEIFRVKHSKKVFEREISHHVQVCNFFFECWKLHTGPLIEKPQHESKRTCRVEVKLILYCFAMTIRNQSRYHEKLELSWGQDRFLIGTMPGMNSIFCSSAFWWFITLYPSGCPLAGLADVHTHTSVSGKAWLLYCRGVIRELNSDTASCEEDFLSLIPGQW